MAGEKALLVNHSLWTSSIKDRLAAIIYLFIVRLPKKLKLSSHAITVFFLSLSEFTMSMTFHKRELYLISCMKWLANEGLSGQFVSAVLYIDSDVLFSIYNTYTRENKSLHMHISIIIMSIDESKKDLYLGDSPMNEYICDQEAEVSALTFGH